VLSFVIVISVSNPGPVGPVGPRGPLGACEGMKHPHTD